MKPEYSGNKKIVSYLLLVSLLLYGKKTQSEPPLNMLISSFLPDVIIVFVFCL